MALPWDSMLALTPMMLAPASAIMGNVILIALI
jgi:hypothetical protein